MTLKDLPGTGTIICPPALEKHCTESYPKRQIIVDIHPPHEEFYVFGKKYMYIVRNKTEVWTLGNEWPFIVRIR